METTIEVKPPGPGFANSDKSVETAVRRLGDTGMDREAALREIDRTLYKALGDLAAAGIGNTSILRQMHLAARMKLNALQVERANQEDARDGI